MYITERRQSWAASAEIRWPASVPLSNCSDSDRQTDKMAEAFVGKYKLMSQENFDDYLKAIGELR